MLIDEDGPFDVFDRIRVRLGTDSDSYRYKITVCYYCLSVWVVAVLALLPWQVSLIFSGSAVVIWLQKLDSH